MRRTPRPMGWLWLALLLSAGAQADAVAAQGRGRGRITGRVFDTWGDPVQQAFVTVRNPETGVAVTAYSDSHGRYVIPGVPEGTYEVVAKHWVFGEEFRVGVPYDGRRANWDFTLAGQIYRYGPSSTFLNQIPDGEDKRRFIVDCTGCHVLNEQIMLAGGNLRTAAEWQRSMSLMISDFGPGTGFPIISSYPDPTRHALWIVRALRSYPDQFAVPAFNERDLARAVLTEYDLPRPQDVPHDLMVDRQGRVVITGTLSHVMYVLDPESGTFDEVAIPVPNASPRALDIGRDGRWWVLLGAPAMLAGYDPRTEEWETFPIGMYPHSIQLDRRGRAWYNGHFTANPELIASLDTRTGEIRQYRVPPVATALHGESTIPYGLRVDRGGTVWGTQLRGNHLIRLEPEIGVVGVWEMPTSHSGPRRLDIGPDGHVWIPEYAGGKLVRFDPDREEFTEFELPIADALPYVVRVDQRRGTVWIGTGAADAVLSFEPSDERFTVYPLPTRGALVRHIDVDEATGDLWAAYGASPGIPPKILRIQSR